MRLAVDLGSSNIRVHARTVGLIEEPALVAVDSDTREILGFGLSAQKTVGRTAPRILQIRPLRDGVIAHHDLTTAMLRHFMRRAVGWLPLSRPDVVMSVSARSTSVEKRAMKEAAALAGAKRVHLVDAPMAAAMGAGLDVDSPFANFLVHVGGSGSDIAVVAMGRLVVHEFCGVGGEAFDRAIARYLSEIYQVTVETSAAEHLKMTLGAKRAAEEAEPIEFEVIGRDPDSGLPQTVMVTLEDTRKALEPPLAELGEAVRTVLERISPELATDIAERGAVLTGGSAMLSGLARFLADVTGLSVRVADNAPQCALIGAARAHARAGGANKAWRVFGTASPLHERRSNPSWPIPR